MDASQLGLNDLLAVVLAGGKGSRLEPLTRDRAKPAVPFGGAYRIVDFVLSNCLNSGLRKIFLLTQYKALSLERHINNGWRQFFCGELGEFIDTVSPQQRIDEHWYRGTADAVYQNIFIIEKVAPKQVLILAGDHIYKMNYGPMIEFHRRQNADMTIGALTVSPAEARAFGVMQVDRDYRLTGFQEKPSQPQPIPGRPDECLASMGIYVFNTNVLFDALIDDANHPDSEHDFGKDIIPALVSGSRLFAYPFQDENRKQQAYWRDVGTLDAYYDANMDLVQVDPMLNLYDKDWPVRTRLRQLPPPKFVFGSEGDSHRKGVALDSVVCSGAIVSGGSVVRSVLGSEVRVNSYASVSESVLLDRVRIGRHCTIRRAIIDKDVVIPEGCEIGVDRDWDRRRGLTVSPGGVVVVGKGDIIPAPRKATAAETSIE